MKKPRRPKPRNKSKDQPTAKNGVENKPITAANKMLQAVQPRQPPWLWRYWQLVWAISGPIVSLTGFAFLLWPQVSIEAGVNLDPEEPLATQFVVTNRGRVTIYNVNFYCGFSIPSATVRHLFFANAEILVPEPAKSIGPGKSVTRACARKSALIVGGQPTITVKYHWPLIGIEDEIIGHFRIVHGAPGYFLVPDLPE